MSAHLFILQSRSDKIEHYDYTGAKIVKNLQSCKFFS